MYLLKITSFVLILAIFSSCSITGIDTPELKVVGQWEWFRATGPWVGEVTRDSTHASYLQHHLVLDSDFTFSRFKADTLQATGEYTLKEKDSETVLRMSYDESEEEHYFDKGVEFQGNDTLVLIGKCYDCWTTYYIRDE